MPVSTLEAIVGFLLVFVAPGFTVAKAAFPERRVLGREGSLWAVELGALTLLLSVVATILAGFILLAVVPAGFSADWSNPLLEEALAAFSILAGAVGVVRGAYFVAPPKGPAPEPSPGSDDGWALMRRIEELGREERRRAHRLRTADLAPSERQRAEAELEGIRSEIRQRQRAREAEYASQ